MEAQSSASISFVSKARTAFHSAAAKAERVFTDIKSDLSDRLDSEKQLKQHFSPSKEVNNEFLLNESSKINSEETRWAPANILAKNDWQEKFKNIRIGRKAQESSNSERCENSTMSVPFYDENVYLLNMKNEAEARGWQLSSIIERLNSIDPDAFPSTSVIKHLGVAVASSKKWSSMKDLIPLSGRTSPKRELSSLSLAAVKSLVLREKEEKLATELGDDERILWLINVLFNADETFLRRNIPTGPDAPSIYKDIHCAPPESLIVKLAEVIGNFKTTRKMAMFWCRVVDELRRLWADEVYIPGIPLDEHPDLNTCLLFQHLEVINCCLSRKRRRILHAESLETITRAASSDSDDVVLPTDSSLSGRILYAQVNSGERVLRLGADRLVEDLKMLETGEPIYAPITQEGPLLTEDLIRENEEFVLRTKSVGAGCSQLLSDMQAFKAANPGCILEDFVRWHSPPDWSEQIDSICEAEESSSRGHLSSRMQKEGNLWRELWETSKAVPAIKQAPLYDEELAVEGILDDLEDIQPSSLFEQLFLSLLGLGFVMAEPRLSDHELSKLFFECKDYVAVTCHGSNWAEKVDDLCQVYETVQTMLTNSEDVLKKFKQADDTISKGGEPKRRFRLLGLNFGSKDRSLRNPSPEESSDEASGAKSSLFSKKPPKPKAAEDASADGRDEIEWAIV